MGKNRIAERIKKYFSNRFGNTLSISSESNFYFTEYLIGFSTGLSYKEVSTIQKEFRKLIAFPVSIFIAENMLSIKLQFNTSRLAKYHVRGF